MAATAPMTNAQWVQGASMMLAAQGYNPNVITRELSAYVAGHHYNFTLIHIAIAAMGTPPNPYDYHSNYQKARERWIETGNLSSLLEMIDAVTLDA